MNSSYFVWFSRGLFVVCALFLVVMAKGWRYDFEAGRLIKTGIIDIHSKPPSAEVWLDEVYYGRTPLVISEIEPGIYDLVLRRDNYYDWQMEVEVFSELATQVEDVILFAQSPDVSFLIEKNFDQIFVGNGGQKYAVWQKNDDGNEGGQLSFYSSRFTLVDSFVLDDEFGDFSNLVGTWNDEVDVFVISGITELGEVSFSYGYWLGEEGVESYDLLSLSQKSSLGKENWFLDFVWLFPGEPLMLIQSETEIGFFDFSTGSQGVFTSHTDFGWQIEAVLPATKSYNEPSVVFLQPVDQGQGFRLLRVFAGVLPPIFIDEGHRFSGDVDLVYSANFSSLLIYDDSSTLVYSHLESSEPHSQVVLEKVDRVFGWDALEERILYSNADGVLSYLDLATGELVRIEASKDRMAYQACWHSGSHYIFYVASDHETRVGRLYAVQEKPNQWVELVSDNNLSSFVASQEREKVLSLSSMFYDDELSLSMDVVLGCHEAGQLVVGVFDGEGVGMVEVVY